MTYKPMWDWMDKAEGRKDSSHDNMMKERKAQGYDKKKSMAKKMKLQACRTCGSRMVHTHE